MKTLATVDHDIYLDPTGNIAMKTKLDAVKESCEHASRALQGDLYFARTRGIPFFDIVMIPNPDLSLYGAYLKRILRTVPRVIDLDSITFEKEENELNYIARIRSDYGEFNIDVDL